MKSWTSPPVPALPGEGGPLTVHDSSTGGPVTLQPEGTARLYVCGITPYDATHLGHAATYLTFDLVQRVWLDAGLQVDYVQNVTDVDEPLLERADRDGVHWEDLAAREIDLFRTDMEALRILAPTHYVGAVEGIPADVDAIRRLLASGAAYRIPVGADEGALEDGASDVYLDLAQQRTFGAVSGWTREEMLEVFAERGGDPGRAGKRDELDPLMWRAAREGEPSWDGATLGRGRPGWHIECSTIALTYLGAPFDVQGGGTDLIFPHHEMSAVQATALEGTSFARAYVHQAMVGLDGEKMSKSKGNLVLVSRLRTEGVDPMVIRLALLAHHYRTPWEWDDSDLAVAGPRWSTWRAAAALAAEGTAPTDLDEQTVTTLRGRLADDLDTAAALLAVDAWAEQVNAGRATAVSTLVPEAVDALLGLDLLG
ncbi:cysteine--1-D-myo-inosityl 2-amino-2-deoxy-alpha-D-glucopyranoside ligase [Ornithinimicrobium tianjinense]|uniref:L-cysteine:1D-myo-inositol 2-amino-2-deoxy-alpha-D-glucopyranoside ligase n=1 Tax=Ornithinimicrobium tianjinense TaxID=1195761 RepID=A0A917BKH4_9MICO|nr:cysteine--1-D-myo-inosityl 2-amino-2-deoxy-alpha-D-glucopyranoside ligase [Ornithinimicrobium tianjinense]GGF47609.1 L-cysteine:1D-myo-inositol 2-amino-2-deoxy-alpha-D-glucopyranoside ligase [Ornithinimicrobium tianjinense]